MDRKNTQNILPGLLDALPSANIPEDANLLTIVSPFATCLPRLDSSTLDKRVIWRDCFALTGTLRTFYSHGTVSEVYRNRCLARQAKEFHLHVDSAHIVRINKSSSWIDVPFHFVTAVSPAAQCSGVLSLIPDRENGEYKIWMMKTLLEQFIGHPSVDMLDPVAGIPSVNESKTSFDCVIVGAGHSGLNTAGRLLALGVSYLVLDRNMSVGDNWRHRYDSAKLHTIRDYSHLPFERTFADKQYEWLTKDDLADGFAGWVKRFHINVWTSSELCSGTWDELHREWTLKINAGEETIKTVTCRHVVLATGGTCEKPMIPSFSGQHNFKGLIQHSIDYRNAWDWKGQRGVIVGAANTAHDIAEDMLNAGLASVTMIQRSRTYVQPQEYLLNAWKPIYNENTPQDISDRVLYAGPIAVSRLTTMAALNSQAESQPERFVALERAGFKTEQFGDIVYLLNERFGGHYVDIGVSDKIARGLIKVKSDSAPVSYTEEGLLFEDGTRLPADVIVFATGYTGTLRDSVRDLFGDKIHAQVEEYWGLDQEGEIRGAYVPTGHPGLWYVGGGLGQVRFFARFVAMQIFADLQGSPLAVYKRPPSQQTCINCSE
ncbi:flavin-containing monooxygenase [Aspergillus clavatus NRRL 1]|uniref:Flavin-containing monooxygenase, putative n=1 Tax=Aspergillus clavatus (strain ATCC 1007 / CBS 513.65 / DSM 816 / NCTC 3887 / NRRL 1 / QM 1276 / 107) TaxID=344612 RepID=A1CE04_ASPCL|nr:flavin-containing monooxygenase, putative [Aspergillus clavatus NRRL 1]EAW12081.1 flavin-containing monooxygenase, putative [Aspergillus clavatus NRRL 1]